MKESIKKYIDNLIVSTFVGSYTSETRFVRGEEIFIVTFPSIIPSGILRVLSDSQVLGENNIEFYISVSPDDEPRICFYSDEIL